MLGAGCTLQPARRPVAPSTHACNSPSPPNTALAHRCQCLPCRLHQRGVEGTADSHGHRLEGAARGSQPLRLLQRVLVAWQAGGRRGRRWRRPSARAGADKPVHRPRSRSPLIAAAAPHLTPPGPGGRGSWPAGRRPRGTSCAPRRTQPPGLWVKGGAQLSIPSLLVRAKCGSWHSRQAANCTCVAQAHHRQHAVWFAQLGRGRHALRAHFDHLQRRAAAAQVAVCVPAPQDRSPGQAGAPRRLRCWSRCRVACAQPTLMPSSKLSAPANTRAVYSPRLSPAVAAQPSTAAGLSARRRSTAASPATNSAGCAGGALGAGMGAAALAPQSPQLLKDGARRAGRDEWQYSVPGSTRCRPASPWAPPGRAAAGRSRARALQSPAWPAPRAGPCSPAGGGE